MLWPPDQPFHVDSSYWASSGHSGGLGQRSADGAQPNIHPALQMPATKGGGPTKRLCQSWGAGPGRCRRGRRAPGGKAAAARSCLRLNLALAEVRLQRASAVPRRARLCCRLGPRPIGRSRIRSLCAVRPVWPGGRGSFARKASRSRWRRHGLRENEVGDAAEIEVAGRERSREIGCPDVTDRGDHRLQGQSAEADPAGRFGRVNEFGGVALAHGLDVTVLSGPK